MVEGYSIFTQYATGIRCNIHRRNFAKLRLEKNGFPGASVERTKASLG
jgi:hypothetical protein